MESSPEAGMFRGRPLPSTKIWRANTAKVKCEGKERRTKQKSENIDSSLLFRKPAGQRRHRHLTLLQTSGEGSAVYSSFSKAMFDN